MANSLRAQSHFEESEGLAILFPFAVHFASFIKRIMLFTDSQALFFPEPIVARNSNEVFLLSKYHEGTISVQLAFSGVALDSYLVPTTMRVHYSPDSLSVNSRQPHCGFQDSVPVLISPLSLFPCRLS
jgi:hypothetical protein